MGKWVAVFLFLSGCNSLVYYPDRVKHVDDRKLTHPPEEIHQGPEFVAWYFRAPQRPARGMFVMFHGNGQNLSAHFAALYWTIDQGYDLFVFDYPGYGITAGDPTPENTVEAGVKALEWAHAREPQLPLIVYGQSLGGAVALRTLENLGGRIPVCLMVLDSTFQSYKEVASDMLASHWYTWWLQPLPYVLISDSQSPKGRLGEISGIPSLSIHSVNDPVVRYRRGKELYDGLSGKKEMLTLTGVGHTDGLVGAEKATARAKLLSAVGGTCGGGEPAGVAPDSIK